MTFMKKKVWIAKQWNDNIPRNNAKHQLFKNADFPLTISTWNKLDSKVQSLETFHIIKSKILKVVVRPTVNNIFGCHNHIRVKLLTRLTLVNENLKTAFKILSIYFAVPEKKLKLLLILSFQAPITLTK